MSQFGGLFIPAFSGQIGPVLTLGYSVSGAGDVNGDGYDDVVVGAWREDPGSSPSGAGRAYVFDGQRGTPLYVLVSPNEEEDGWFGSSVSDAGDVNGDGYGDVVVGAHEEDPGSSPSGAGRAYVFDGQTGMPIHTLFSNNEEGGGTFGYSVSGAGEVDGDGYDDVVVGTAWEDPGSSPNNAGRAYVFSWLHLSSCLAGSALELQWSTWSPSSEYWVYGADNLPWFNPGSAPGFQYRITVLPSTTTTWSTTNGVGDPGADWTYLVMAVDETEAELARSNRVGEHDFDTDVP